MDLTVKSALTKGIEAHKAGQLQEADKFYTAILKVQPTHPDANHNMGVLAVGVGKVEESIPFFETALKSNSTITQFWLSYIDALTKLGRLDDAQAAHDDAKHKGIKGEALDKLQATISDKKGFSSPNMLNTSEINKALHLAKKYARDGLFDKAQSIYKDILHKFPKNKRAVQGLKRLSDKTSVNEVKPQKDPPKEQLQRLIIQFNQGQLQQVLEEVELLLEDFQNSVVLYNLKGAINAGLKKFDIAIASYKQAIKIKPDYAEAHCNLANAFRDMGDPENAIRNYKKAIKIKPNFAEAYNNLGLALYEKGNFQEAKKNFEYAIKNRPNFAEAYNHLGLTLNSQGKLENAQNNFLFALKIKPNYLSAKLNIIEFLTSSTPSQKVLHPLFNSEREIRKIDINSIAKDFIPDSKVTKLIFDCTDILKKYDITVISKQSQIYRKNSIDLDCKRHKSVFFKHGIIPEFCFGCYKVQVEPTSVIELIKLFLVFDRLNLNKNNTRKCMVETRADISGFYKGLIYCSSLDEANKIADKIHIRIKKALGREIDIKVKRGCSEYPLSFPDYKYINNAGPQPMNYNKNWKLQEEYHDKQYPFNRKASISPTLSGLSLSDVLIIRNWLSYAIGIGDVSITRLNNSTIFIQDFFQLAESRLSRHPFSN